MIPCFLKKTVILSAYGKFLGASLCIAILIGKKSPRTSSSNKVQYHVISLITLGLKKT